MQFYLISGEPGNAGGGIHVDSSIDFAFSTDLITTRFVMRAGHELVDERAICVGSNV